MGQETPRRKADEVKGEELKTSNSTRGRGYALVAFSGTKSIESRFYVKAGAQTWLGGTTSLSESKVSETNRSGLSVLLLVDW